MLWAGVLAPLLTLLLASGIEVRPATALVLTIPKARATARQALLAGDAGTAAAIGRALLKRDGNDFTALIILAGAEQALGKNDIATIHAKRAYNLTHLKHARFDAAMIISRAQFGEKHYTLAQFWLRRSGEVAPTSRLHRLARRDFRYVAQINPVETRLRVGISPSNNINNGSQSSTTIINGLPFVLSGDARALSGTVASLGLKVKRRFSQGAGKTAYAGVNLLSRSYRLSPASRAISRGKTGADYAFQAAEIETGFNRPKSRNSTIFTIGRNWYAGAALTNYVRAQIQHGFSPGKAATLAIGLSAERQIRLDSIARSATLGDVSLSARIPLGHGNRATLRYDIRDVFSGAAEISNITHTISAGYQLAKPVLGANLSFAATINSTGYKSPYLSASPRRDFGISARVSILLPKYEVMGFAPNIDINLSRNLSSERLFNRTRRSISIGVKSTF